MQKRDYGPGNAPEDYETLTDMQKRIMSLWISERIAPVSRKMRAENRLISYGLKHQMEREIGLYVSNGQFKGGMAAAGYEAFDTDGINWTYNIELKRLPRSERGA